MCSNPEHFSQINEYGYNQIYSRMLSSKEKIKDIVITGGEPTIHPDFSKIFELLKREFSKIKIRLLTNGRMFTYDSFSKKCFELKNLSIDVSLHGYNAYTHDKITSVEGSFTQTVKGILNMLKYRRNRKQAVSIRVVISFLNVGYLHKVLDFICKNLSGVDGVALIFMEIEGLAEKNLDKLRITYWQFRKHLRILESRFNCFNFFKLFHFPLCVIDESLWKYVWRTLDKDETIFIEKCESCWCRQYCLGIPKSYYKVIGGEEFSPPPEIFVEKDYLNPWSHPIANVTY